MDALAERLALQLDFLKLYTQVRKRPWGLLLYNLENPDYHEANGARYVRCQADESAAVIDEIVRFYRTRRLTPRVDVDPQTEPVDFRQRLEASGFESTPSEYRVMRWQGDAPPPPELPAGVKLAVATPYDIEAVVQIEADDSPWAGTEWLRRRTKTLMAKSSVRYYVIWVDGVPAATAMCFWTDKLGFVESVATRPAYRRRGLASAIIQRMQMDTPTPLMLDVEAENAERVYARRGFAVVGQAPVWSCWLPAD